MILGEAWTWTTLLVPMAEGVVVVAEGVVVVAEGVVVWRGGGGGDGKRIGGGDG